jgi:hypothetical protein
MKMSWMFVDKRQVRRNMIANVEAGRIKLRYLAQIPRHQMLMVVAGVALVLVVAVAVIVERKPF